LSINPISAAKPLFLGLDFGTSGARASLIDRAGLEHFQTGVSFRDNAWQEWREWREALHELIDAIPADLRKRIAALAFCGTSGTSLLCDEHGEPLLPAILYNDNRAIDQANRIPGESIAASATSSLAKLMWLQEQPGTQDACYFLHQADWLALQLHGLPGLSDYHNSLKLGYDVEKLAYPSWMQASDYATLLPRVREPGNDYGTIAPHAASFFDLPENCLIRAGTTDSIAAFFASGASAPGQAVTSLGSTLVLKLLSRTRVESPEHGVYSHRCGNMWLAGGASNCGGNVLERIFGRERLQSLSAQLNPEQPTGLDYYPLPAPGERFPINDPTLQPRLEPRPTDDALYLQGLLESLARIETQGYRLLKTLGATPLREVMTAGGGASNTAWTRIREQMLGVPVSAAPNTEAAYGAARLAMLGEKLLYSTQ
jgi:sugar (pentulose or hexulose) kinase